MQPHTTLLHICAQGNDMIVDVEASPVPAQNLNVDSIEIISCFQDKLLVLVSLLGRVRANPTLIMTTAPMRGIMVSIYVSISLSIYVCVIYPAFVAPWSPRSVYALKCSGHVFRYIDVLMCVIYNCMH